MECLTFLRIIYFSGEMTSDFFRVVNEARSHSLGPFSPSFNIQTSLLEGLQKFLPPDAHERVNGRLHISLTRSHDGKNIIVSQFDSREDLLQALLCACFIPGFSGILPPKFKGVRYMDGAFSDNLPILDENTITVSPFCGESDICPRDQSAQLFHVSVQRPHCDDNMELQYANCWPLSICVCVIPGELGEYQHRTITPEYKSFRAHSVSTEARGSVQYVSARFR